MGNSGSSTASRRTKAGSSKEAIKVHLPLEDVKEQLRNGTNKWGLQVDTPHLGYRDCYLDTTDMSMRYLTPQQPWSYGNASLNWMIRNVGDKGAHHLSNSVTDYPNESPRIGISKTYLETATRLSSGGYSLKLMGNGVYVYFEHDPNEHTQISIYMQLDESSNADKYYLQPTDTTDDNTIVAKTEAPQNKYNFAIVDPEPTSS